MTTSFQAIYLPVWKLDYVCRLIAEKENAEYTWEFEVLDGSLIGTHVHPLSSIPNIFSDMGDLAGAMEPYNPQIHRNTPSKGGRAFDGVSSPVRIAFSRYPSDITQVHKEVAKHFEHGTVAFKGTADTLFEAAYPLLLPCYLFELADLNKTATKSSSVGPYWKRLVFIENCEY